MITSANAVQMQQLGIAAKRAKKEKTELTLRIVETSDFASKETIRIREHIERVNDLLEACAEPVDILRLSQALNKLHEDERKLAGRPDPGSYRPVAPKATKTVVGEPLD